MKKYLFFLFSSVTIFSCNNNGSIAGDNSQSDTLKVETNNPQVEQEKEMKEMLNSAAPKENPYKDAKIDIQIFNNDTVKAESKIAGYGYNILMYDAIYVHQPHIPAINGNRGFKTKEQARKAAEFVVYKIRNNIMPPSMSPKELDSLGTIN